MATNPFDQQAPIKGIKHIILIGSGKGGVGKSSLSSNIAVGLNKLGKSVGLLDSDIYGPSQPRIFGITNQKPALDSNQKLIPPKRYGVKVMSMGLLIDEQSAVVWRGPMLFKAIEQLLKDVHWAPLDYLIVDLPPGTGDIALTIAQKVPVSAAAIVCTPQNLALIDAKKSLDMFDRIGVPVFGVIENKSYFLDSSGEKKALYPPGDLNNYLKAKNIPHLGAIPFEPQLALCCEAGVPLIESDEKHPVSLQILEICKKIISSYS